MVDLQSQYKRLSGEINAAIQQVLDSSQYINGTEVKHFENELSSYLGANHVIGCANGTDALQIALMALELPPDSEIILPAFTYVATIEVVCLLGYTPVLVDVNASTFNLDETQIKDCINANTKAIMPVHLFGQAANMERIMEIATANNLYVIEDNAQAIGSQCSFNNNTVSTGTIGDIGTTSFFPSKNLGCYGDGGALTTQNPILAERIRKIANHGQVSKYHHSMLGVNSRLDTIQAAILNVKLKHLDSFVEKRRNVAQFYDNAFANSTAIEIPFRASHSSHVFHQYTVKLNEGRDEFQAQLKKAGISSTVYYPLPVHQQIAYKEVVKGNYPNAEALSKQVLSLPIHTELDQSQLEYITETVLAITG